MTTDRNSNETKRDCINVLKVYDEPESPNEGPCLE